MLGMVSLGMNLLVLLEILGALEALLADLADMGLERGVDAEMGGDVVALCAGCAAVLPPAGQTEVVRRLAADMVVAEVVIEMLGVDEGLGARVPETLVRRGGGGRGRAR